MALSLNVQIPPDLVTPLVALHPFEAVVSMLKIAG